MEKEYKSMQEFSDSLYDEFNIDIYTSKASFKKTVENYCKKIKIGTGERETTIFDKSKTDPNSKESNHIFLKKIKQLFY